MLKLPTIILVLGGAFLWLPGHRTTVAEQVPISLVTAGAGTTANGSLLNLGQSVIGRARSNTHQMNAGGIYGIVSLSTPPLRSDLDGDGDVDLFDFATFDLCFNGRDNRPDTSCPSGVDADFDEDVDVDLTDYAAFLAGWPGQ